MSFTCTSSPRITTLRAPILSASIQTLLDRFDDETTVYPGHMGLTTLGRERATNPFLRELV